MIGQRFGRLIVLSESYKNNKTYRKYYLCQCDCGNTKTIVQHSLKNGDTLSCGCLQKERASHAKKIHGLANTDEYTTYTGMLRRCYDPQFKDFHRYGGRGITVCTRWRDNFEIFLQDMGERPFKKAQIDRINNDGNYEPANCRWVDQSQNCRNTRKNRYITLDGETKLLMDWAKDNNIPVTTIYGRLKNGWSEAQSVRTPVMQQYSRKRTIHV